MFLKVKLFLFFSNLHLSTKYNSSTRCLFLTNLSIYLLINHLLILLEFTVIEIYNRYL